MVSLAAANGVANADLCCPAPVLPELSMGALASMVRPATGLTEPVTSLPGNHFGRDNSFPPREGDIARSTPSSKEVIGGGRLDPGVMEISELPPGPGSGRLVCSGLLTLLAWPVFRSARHLHLGAAPCWLQTTAPAQIRHSVAANGLTVAPLVACRLEIPMAANAMPPVIQTDHVVGRRLMLPPSGASGPRAPPSLICS